jgi:hypothetical protein
MLSEEIPHHNFQVTSFIRYDSKAAIRRRCAAVMRSPVAHGAAGVVGMLGASGLLASTASCRIAERALDKHQSTIAGRQDSAFLPLSL